MEASTRVKKIDLSRYLTEETKYVVQYKGDLFFDGESLDELLTVCHTEAPGSEPVFVVRSHDELLSDELKVLICIEDRMYHFLADHLPLIYKLYRLNPDIRFVLYINKSIKELDVNIFQDCLFDVLHSLDAKYTVIENDPDSDYSPVYKIANYITTDQRVFGHNQNLSLLDVRDAINYVKDLYLSDIEPVEPFRKIYLARTFSDRELGSIRSTDDGYTDDIRMYEEEALSNYFKEAGLEIVYPELRFKNLRDQIQFMSEVKTLVAVTASGLSNGLFMKPGQKIIEILAEVVTVRTLDEEGYVVLDQILPSEYQPLSFLMGHTHVMVSTFRDPYKAIEEFENGLINYV